MSSEQLINDWSVSGAGGTIDEQKERQKGEILSDGDGGDGGGEEDGRRRTGRAIHKPCVLRNDGRPSITAITGLIASFAV